MVKGRPTPVFELNSLQDKPVDYPADFQNKVVVISFWADWCPICKKEMRDFEVLYQKYKKRGLSVVAINIAQDQATAEAFIEDLGLTYSVVLDIDGKVARNYGIYSLPAVVVVDRDGNLDTRVLGETGIDTFDSIVTSLL
jgi:peroxiredoxin